MQVASDNGVSYYDGLSKAGENTKEACKAGADMGPFLDGLTENNTHFMRFIRETMGLSEKYKELIAFNRNDIGKIDRPNIPYKQDFGIGSQMLEFMKGYKVPKALGEDLKQGIIELDGVLYQMPVPLREFRNNGWKVITQASDPIGTVTLLKTTQRVTAITENYDQAEALSEDSIASAIECSDDENKPPFKLPRDIEVGMTLEDLEKALTGVDYKKVDNDVIEFSISYRDSSPDGIYISVHKKTGLICLIKVVYNPKHDDGYE